MEPLNRNRQQGAGRVRSKGTYPFAKGYVPFVFVPFVFPSLCLLAMAFSWRSRFLWRRQNARVDLALLEGVLTLHTAEVIRFSE